MISLASGTKHTRDRARMTSFPRSPLLMRQIRYKDSMNPGAALFTLNIIFCLVLFLSLGATTITISENTFAQTGEESSPGFDSSPPSEFVSGGNLSELPDSDSPLGLEPPDINGTYANPNVGLQVDLPKDWNGKEITFLLDMVVAAPPGIEIESIDEPGTAMIIQVLDREAFDELARMQGADPLSMKAGEGDQCKELPASFVTINGLKAEQRSGDCTDEEGSSTKVKAYTFATADGTIILLAFAGNSVNEYNQYLPEFEESVKTIKIENPGDINTSELYKKHKELEMQSQANVTMK